MIINIKFTTFSNPQNAAKIKTIPAHLGRRGLIFAAAARKIRFRAPIPRQKQTNPLYLADTLFKFAWRYGILGGAMADAITITETTTEAQTAPAPGISAADKIGRAHV